MLFYTVHRRRPAESRRQFELSLEDRALLREAGFARRGVAARVLGALTESNLADDGRGMRAERRLEAREVPAR